MAQLGGPSTPSTTRIKSYKLLALKASFIAITGSSDGTIRVWHIPFSELLSPSAESSKATDGESEPETETREEHTNGKSDTNSENVTNGQKITNGKTNGMNTKQNERVRQVGSLMGTCETGNRITCLEAFVMDGLAESSSAEDDQARDLQGGDSNGSTPDLQDDDSSST